MFNKRSMFWAIVCSSSLFFVACGSDSSSAELTSSSSSTDVPVSSSTTVVATTVLPAGANATYSADLFTFWKSTYYITYAEQQALGSTIDDAALADAGRVKWQTSKTDCRNSELSSIVEVSRICTVSEGIGYGMLIAYFQDDWDVFLGLWDYSSNYRQSLKDDGQLTYWLIKSFSSQYLSTDAATDADLDIATALILGYYKLQTDNPTLASQFLADAIRIANSIWTWEINPTNLLIYPGDTDMWKNGVAANVINPSYFSPVAFRLFAIVDPSHNWQGVLDANYTYMQTLQANGDGLFPDWANLSYVPQDPQNGSAETSYFLFDKESVRVPWRIAWDYYWYQDTRAQTILNTMLAYVLDTTGGSVANLSTTTYPFKAALNLGAGTNAGGNHYLGAYCLMGMGGGSQAWLDACFDSFAVASMSGFNYYQHILQMMFSQLLNGLYIRPY